MNCEHIQSLLVPYLDGEVTPSERTLIQAHLSKCIVCQQELSLLSTARSRVRSMLQRRAVHAVPSAEAWNRLEAKLPKGTEQPTSKFEVWFTSKAPGVKHASNLHKKFGGVLMNKRSIFSAMAGAVVLAILAVFVARNVTPASASARQIMDRAYEVQSQQSAEQGIQHIRTEIFSNLETLPEAQGSDWIVESYFDLQSGNFRMVSTDTQTGKVTEALAYDGSYEYNSEGTKSSTPEGSALIIYRSPLTQASALSQKLRLRYGVEGLDAKTLFDKMRNDPNTQLAGKETWEGGLHVYALRSQQPLKVLVDTNVAEPMGLVTVYFEVDTYRIAGSRVTMEKDGKELLISLERTLMNETL
ncbi:MAG TPA: zf-HC2 domain-containing protein, partial [Anaerolineales bacterium]|nr:zf-HC2 domain-containing protein [Anaerolineales bacterium]